MTENTETDEALLLEFIDSIFDGIKEDLGLEELDYSKLTIKDVVLDGFDLSVDYEYDMGDIDAD